MILFTVGTHLPFDRLTRVAADVAASGERVVVQDGGGAPVAGVELLGVVSFEELTELVQSARVVVTHAGVGSILTCVRNGVTPIVVPRRASFGEAADDHQLAFARRLGATGLVRLVEDPAGLPAAIAAHRPSVLRTQAAHGLTEELRAYLRANVRA